MEHAAETTLRRRLLRAAGIAEGERRLAALTAALFLVTQSTHGLGANAADTLFFLRFGVEELPRMIAFAGVAVMALVLAHTLGLTRLGDRAWLPLVTGVSAGWVFLTWLGVFLDRPFIYPIIWVSTQAIIMVTFTMMWNAAGAVCTTRQAKRLFPLFATAGVFGGILGNLATGPITSLLGTQSLLLAQSGLLAVSTLVVLRIGGLMREEAPDDPAESVARQLRSALRSIRLSRLLRLAAGVSFTTWILFYLVVFPFSEAVASAFDDEAGVASFLGVFSSLATALTFVVGLVVAKRLFARFGIVTSLLILPLVYAAGFAIWLWDFDLTTAALVRGAQWVALNAIGGTAFTALFNVLTGKRRAQIVALMTAVPAQLGTIAGGLALLASRSTSDGSRFWLGLVVSLAAVGLVAAMRPAYVEAVLSSVRKGLVGLFSVPGAGLFSPADADAARILEAHLRDERPEARAYALSALARLEGAGGIEGAASYLEDRSPLVRMTAFDLMCDWDPEGFRSHARIALADESPEVRARALHYAASHDALDLVLEALTDSDSKVRATAAAIVGGAEGRSVALDLIATGDTRAKRALLVEAARSPALDVDMSRLLDDQDAEVRALAAQWAAGSVAPDSLRPLLDDRSLRVRRAAASALATTEAGTHLLMETLQVGTVNETDAALRALMPLDGFSDSFVGWARGEAERAAHLDRLGRALDDEADSMVGDYLRRVLAARADRLEQWVLMAMTTVDTAETMPLVQRGIVSGNAETRAQAIEALEAVGDRRVLEVLLPLLDRARGGEARDEREALRELTGDFDPWLRGLAMRRLAEIIESDLTRLYDAAQGDEDPLVKEFVPSLAKMSEEKHDTLGLMDRVLALQRVPMFSQLDPEDLEVVARSMREVFFHPDEAIYREGEEGDEALMIVEGSALVTITRDGEQRLVNRYGAGDSVGELALLGSGTRSADVTAGPDGLHGVVMTKQDFVSTLEERPSVALGMLSTLAARIAEET